MGRLHHGTALQSRKPTPRPPLATLKSILGSKIVVDLDSDAGVVPAGGGLISAWTDQGSLANTPTQAVGANQPSAVANVLDGHAAIRFDGSRWLSLPSTFAGIAAGDFPRIYVIASWVGDLTTFNGMLVSLSIGTSQQVMKLGATAQNVYLTEYRNSAFKNGGAQPIAPGRGVSNNPGLIDIRNDPTVFAMRFQDASEPGSFVCTATGIDFTPTRLIVGADLSATVGSRHLGDIFRVIIVSPPPTAAEHIAIIGYLRRLYSSMSIWGTTQPIVLASAPTLAQINGASLVLDLNSDVGVSSTAGAVSAWADSSGHSPSAIAAQATGSLQPTVVASVLDGHSAIRFDGSDDCLDAASGIVGLPAGALPYVYCVWAPRNTSPTYLAEVYSFAGSSAETHNLALYHYTDGGLYARADGAVAGATPESNFTARVTTQRLTAGAHTLDLNNVQIGTVAPSATGLQVPETQVRLGKRWDNAFPGNIDIFRLAVVNPPPTAAQHAANMEFFRRQYPSAGLGDAYQAILGGLMIERWDCRQNVYAPGGNVFAWKGTERGYPLTPVAAGNAPTLAVDTGYFNSIPVIQCAKTGSKYLQCQALPAPLFMAGTRPYLIVVGRYRSHSGNSVLIDVRGTDSASATYSMLTTGVVIVPTMDAGAISGTAYTATTPSAFALYETAAGVPVHARDGVIVSNAGSGFSMNTDKTKIGVGAQWDGGFPGDVSIAMVIAVSSVPSATQLLALAKQIGTDFATLDTLPSILGTQLMVDLDPDVGISFGVSPKVSGWADQSGRGNSPSQSTALKQPTQVLSVLDGHASMRTDGSDDSIRVGGTLTGLLAGDRPYIYCAYTPRAGAVPYNDTLVCLDTNGTAGTTAQLELLYHTANTIKGINGTTTVAPTDTVLATPRLATLRWESATLEIDLNNGVLATTPSGGLSATPLWMTLGDRIQGVSVPGATDYFRVAIANPAPSPTQHARVIAYLKQRYPSLGLP
jgi:hypothetical protein